MEAKLQPTTMEAIKKEFEYRSDDRKGLNVFQDETNFDWGLELLEECLNDTFENHAPAKNTLKQFIEIDIINALDIQLHPKKLLNQLWDSWVNFDSYFTDAPVYLDIIQENNDFDIMRKDFMDNIKTVADSIAEDYGAVFYRKDEYECDIDEDGEFMDKYIPIYAQADKEICQKVIEKMDHYINVISKQSEYKMIREADKFEAGQTIESYLRVSDNDNDMHLTIISTIKINNPRLAKQYCKGYLEHLSETERNSLKIKNQTFADSLNKRLFKHGPRKDVNKKLSYDGLELINTEIL